MASESKVLSPVILMIDNETLSLRPDAHIVQVGYNVVNLLTREYLVAPTSVFLKGRKPGHIDIGTVKYWMGQNDAARAGVFSNNRNRPYVTPNELFDVFGHFRATYGEGMTVWAGPAMFDLPQLTMMWAGKKPWSYDMERDFKTFYKMFDPKGELAPPPLGDQHNGEDDAHWQSEYMLNLVEMLKFTAACPWVNLLMTQDAPDVASAGPGANA